MNKKQQNKTNKLISFSLISYFIMALVNYLGATGVINGLSQKEVSLKYPTLITPAGFTFSIWGIIYFLILLTFLIAFIKKNDPRTKEFIDNISPLFILSSFFNILWIILFSYEKIGASVIVILALLISLMLILDKIKKNRKNIIYLLPTLSFSVYAGWLFIASIVNVAALLVKIKWSAMGIDPGLWSAIILCAAVVFVLAYVFLKKNALFPISLIWAFYGIYSTYADGSKTSAFSGAIQIILLVGMALFTMTVIFTFFKNGKDLFPREKF